VYDALTTTRSYRGAMTAHQAVAEITRCRNHWAPPVYDAFMRAVGEPALAAEQRQELAA
jgi:HD-GYP domain-containing protein (c-di-GMP phosphodiesterase class II)